MPELLIPVIVSAGVTGGVAFGGATISFAGIAAYAVTAGAVAGIEYGASLFGDGKRTDVRENFKQALPVRTRAYGYCKLGGAYYFADKSGSTLVLGFVHCEGPIDSIVEFWLGDVQAATAPGALDGIAGKVPGKNKLLLDAQLGTVDQTPNAGLLSVVPNWGPSRRLAGLANTVMRCYLPSDPGKTFQTYYPSGVPALRVVARTALVTDPRTGAYGFSENLGLAIRDYLLHPDGAALRASRVDDASFAAYATVCDELISKADGSNEPRYRIGQGTYDLTERKADVIKRLLAAGDAQFYTLPSGKIGIRGGVWVEPTVTITTDMVSGYTYQAGAEVLSAYNQLRIRYIDQDLDYQLVEGDPWVAPGTAGDVANDFEGTVVPSYNQARRLGKIKTARDNPAHILKLTCFIAAIDAWGEAVVRLQLPELAIDETFAVNRCELAADGAGLTLDVSSLDASAYQWDPSQEGQGAPNVNVTAPILDIPAVSGFALSLVRITVTGGLGAAQIQAAVSQPADPSLSLHAQYRVSNTTDWTDMAANGAFSALSPIAADGTTYDVQVAYQAYGGEDGPWTADTIDVEVDPAAPGVPQSINATLQSGAASLSAVGPASANLYALRFYRSASTDFASAVLIATVYGGGGGTFGVSDGSGITGVTHYWATAINHSGVASAPAGPATVTA